MIIPLGMKMFLEDEEIDIQTRFSPTSIIRDYDKKYMVEFRFYDTEARREHKWTFHALVLASKEPYEGVGRIHYQDGISEGGDASLRLFAKELNKLLEEK